MNQIPPLPHPLEKTPFRPQKYAARLHKIKTQILAASALLATQGAVIATWRKRGNSQLGPYYRLRYYENRTRRSIYLGRSEELAQAVRRLLFDLQYTRISRRLRNNIRKSMRIQKKQLQSNLHTHGYHIKGFKIHKSKSPSQTRSSQEKPGNEEIGITATIHAASHARPICNLHFAIANLQ
jgi:hypothetical protein